MHAAAAVASAVAAAAAPEPEANFSTSSFTMRPLGPEPFTCNRGMPRSRAMRFAIGLALKWSIDASFEAEPLSSLSRGLGAADLSSSSLLASFCFDSSSFALSSCLAAFSASPADAEADSLSASFASASAPDKSSPSSPIIAMVEFTGTFFEPASA